jgi:hypothetical protein
MVGHQRSLNHHRSRYVPVPIKMRRPGLRHGGELPGSTAPPNGRHNRPRPILACAARDGRRTQAHVGASTTDARSRERLAAALQVTLEELETYLEGDKPVPDAAFMVALDIVATGTDRFS